MAKPTSNRKVMGLCCLSTPGCPSAMPITVAAKWWTPRNWFSFCPTLSTFGLQSHRLPPDPTEFYLQAIPSLPFQLFTLSLWLLKIKLKVKRYMIKKFLALPINGSFFSAFHHFTHTHTSAPQHYQPPKQPGQKKGEAKKISTSNWKLRLFSLCIFEKFSLKWIEEWGCSMVHRTFSRLHASRSNSN